MNSTVLDRSLLLKQLNDEELFEMYSDYPCVTDMLGYSSEARLHLAKNVSALRMELKLRNLIP
jgi:hypothetical protein